MKALSRAVGSLPDFLASSRGAWLRSDSFIYFHTHSGLTGYFVWADLSDEELDLLTAIIRASLALEPHPSVIDLRGIRFPPMGLYERLTSLLADQAARFSTLVERLALVRPPGFTGAAVAGVFSVVKAPYPVEVFESLDPALEWLGQSSSAEVARELEDVVAVARGVPAFLHRLRVRIESSLLHQTSKTSRGSAACRSGPSPGA